MTKKDYSLLRPFDLEAAKAGALLCDQSGPTLAGLLCCTPDSSGYFWVWVNCIGGIVSRLHSKNIRLAPLCWVEGKPVYPGDMLEVELVSWGDWREATVARSGFAHDGERIIAEGVGKEIINAPVSMCRWPRPKPVKRWINIYPNTGYDTKAAADQVAAIGRIACVEIELPPLKS